MAESFLNIKLQSKSGILDVKANQLTLSKSFERKLTDKKFTQKGLLQVANLIKEKITDNILKGKTFRGGNVAKLAKSTIKRKKSSRPLVETGKLSNSVVVATDSGKVVVRMARNRYAKSKATIEQVAGYLQEGTARMPSRPFFGITQKDLNRFVTQVFGKGFFK